MLTFGIDQSELGWELTYAYDGGPAGFGPEGSAVYATKAEAQRACEQAAAESRAWNSRPLCDAPHMDNF